MSEEAEEERPAEIKLKTVRAPEYSGHPYTGDMTDAQRAIVVEFEKMFLKYWEEDRLKAFSREIESGD